MKVDPVLLREIKNAAGTTRTQRLAFLEKCGAFSTEFGNAVKKNNGLLMLTTLFNKALLSFPRSVVACCLAATIVMRDGLSLEAQVWAQGVLEAWNPTSSQRLRAYIDDNLNPTRIEEYAGSFIKLTTV